MSIGRSDVEGGSSWFHPVQQQFEESRKHYEDAEKDFGQVADRIRSGHEWKGEGTADAKKVMETNALALAASRVISESAWLALDGFRYALDRASHDMKKLDAKAADLSLKIHEDLSVTYVKPAYDPTGSADPGYEHERSAHALAHKDEIERKAKGIAAYAHVADLTCSDLLDELGKISPVTTDTADPKALAASRNALAGALGAREVASLAHRFWHDAKPKAVPKDPDYTGKLISDVIDVSGSAASVVQSLSGARKGDLYAIPTGLKDAKGFWESITGLFGDTQRQYSKNAVKYKPLGPHASVDDLIDSYSDSENLVTRDDTGEGYSTDNDGVGAPKNGEDQYDQYTGIGKRNDSHEEIVVDNDTGDVYYTDDNGKSYVKLQD